MDHPVVSIRRHNLRNLKCLNNIWKVVLLKLQLPIGTELGNNHEGSIQSVTKLGCHRTSGTDR